jgi:hypothetical protein
MKRFTWDCWCVDGWNNNGVCVIAKSWIPDRDDVNKSFVYDEWMDTFTTGSKPNTNSTNPIKITEGWCTWQVRADWIGNEGTPTAWWYVKEQKTKPPTGRGWFPVWILRTERGG